MGRSLAEETVVPAKPIKPSMRGVLHHWAAVAALGAGVVLVAMAPTLRAQLASAVYMASVVTLFSVSAIYHRPTWTPEKRALMRRLDHASIFVLIAGTYTPICLLAMPEETGTKLLRLVWAGAGLGIIKSVFWAHAPKPVTAIIYLFVGWTVVPYFGALVAALSPVELAFFVGGGVVYSVGAVVYALRRPNIVKDVFGYHEVFHALTLVACAMHFGVILGLVRVAH